jgi:DeoR/GlpR family transcriptional regulator of sugar metabolism
MDVTTRRRQMLDDLHRDGEIQVTEIAARLGCSEMTVRRDLDVLEQDGVLRRVHGGAVALHLRRHEVPYGVRCLQHLEAKQRIGRAVAELLADGETVVVDSGTTALEVARHLRGRSITVLPLGVRPLLELADDTETRLIVPGGDVRAGELVFTGELTEVAFERLRFDTFVLGCCGVDGRDGLTTHVPEDARVKRAAVQASRRTIAVCDASKLGRVAFGHICDLADLDRLVTDIDADADLVQRWEMEGVTVDCV